MANVTIGFGVALILVGLGGYFATGMQSWTALIPAIIGALLAGLGVLGRDPGKRKHAMHAAAVVALVAILATVRGAVNLVRYLAGAEFPDPERVRPAAWTSQAITAVLLAIFLVLCIRSFIEARRARVGAAV